MNPPCQSSLTSEAEGPIDLWIPSIIEAAQAARRTAPTDTQDALSQLRQVDHANQHAIRALVQHGLATGMTWQQIGSALGTSRQAAHHRYGSLPSPTSRQPRPAP
jgi:hypothetical protein